MIKDGPHAGCSHAAFGICNLSPDDYNYWRKQEIIEMNKHDKLISSAADLSRLEKVKKKTAISIIKSDIINNLKYVGILVYSTLSSYGFFLITPPPPAIGPDVVAKGICCALFGVVFTLLSGLLAAAPIFYYKSVTKRLNED